LGMIFSKALEGISRNPEAMESKIWLVFVGAGMVELFGLAAIGYVFVIL
jgi:F0F1-type ATP synthase membrane subunit c/vacuolar-type H+-ATPase subunit K